MLKRLIYLRKTQLTLYKHLLHSHTLTHQHIPGTQNYHITTENDYKIIKHKSHLNRRIITLKSKPPVVHHSSYYFSWVLEKK